MEYKKKEYFHQIKARLRISGRRKKSQRALQRTKRRRSLQIALPSLRTPGIRDTDFLKDGMSTESQAILHMH